jgi:hypothetical protein
MRKQELSRRKVLAGLATAGGGSAFVGSGASALLTDEETFTNNAVRASTSVSGEMQLDVETRMIDAPSTFGNDGRKLVPNWSVSIPDEEGDNNTGYVWLRLLNCPVPVSLARYITVDLEIHCDTRTETLVEGPLLDVADRLRAGIPIDGACTTSNPGQQACLSPGEEITVVFDWDLDGYQGDGGSLPITFEFHALQCRYNDGSDNPFPEVESCEDASNHAISYVAFCSNSDDPIEPDTTVLASDEDGPTEIEWQTGQPVTHVIVMAGQECKLYSYPNGATSGTVNSGHSDLTDADVELVECNNSSPCSETGSGGNSVKLEWEDGAFVMEAMEEAENETNADGKNGGGNEGSENNGNGNDGNGNTGGSNTGTGNGSEEPVGNDSETSVGNDDGGPGT